MTSNKTPVVKKTDNQIGKIPVAKIQKNHKEKTNIQSNKVSADTNEEIVFKFC
jgi:histone H3/H4